MDNAAMKTALALVAIVVVAAEGSAGEGVVISGGRTITDWTVDGKGWWHASVEPGTRSTQFFVNRQRRQRPHLPRQGYFKMAKNRAFGEEWNHRFTARAGDIPEELDLAGAEACTFHHWQMLRLPVTGYDAERRWILTSSPKVENAGFPFGESQWYLLENVKGALGEPGDWYLDKSGELTYVPKSGETPENSECVLAVKDTLLTVRGETNTVYRGYTFIASNFTVPERGVLQFQGTSEQPSAVVVEDSKGVIFEDCAFINIGGNAIHLKKNADGCIIRNCEFYDIGASAVCIGPGVRWNWYWEGEETKGAVVEDCLIEHCGRFLPQGIGIWLGFANNCRVERNTIRDLYYSGISCGWLWRKGRTGAHHNLIRANDVRKIGQRRLSDMGGIYLLGEQEGTVVEDNEIRDVSVARSMCEGIYLDAGSSFMTIRGNFVDGAEDCALFHTYSGNGSVIENNLFVNSGNYVVRRQPCDGSKFPGAPSVLRGNILHARSADCPFADETLPDDISFKRENNLKLLHEERLEIASFADVEKVADVKSIGFKPLAIGAAGRKAPAKRTVGLPSVPEIFPPAEPYDPLANGTLGGIISNKFACFEFDACGGVKVNGKAMPFVELEMKDGTMLVPERVVLEAGKYLHFRYPNGRFHITVKTDEKGVSFTLGGFKIYGVKRISVFGVPFDPRHGLNGKVVRFDGKEFSAVANPLGSDESPDPFVTWDDVTQYYYLLFTRGNDLCLFRSKDLVGLRDGEKKILYLPRAEDLIFGNIWAPEMHKAPNGKWYVYTSGSQGKDAGTLKRLFVLESKTADPFDGFVYKGKPIPDEPRKNAEGKYFSVIDPTVFTADDGRQYICYSYCTRNQTLVLREMENPWTFGVRQAEIARAELPWELVDQKINEGAFFVRSPDRKRLFIVYSANGCWSDDYCLGVLEHLGGDLCDAKNWKKHPKPLFVKGNGAFGPGHASFFRASDGTLWCAYHAMKASNPERKPAKRWLNLRRVGFDETGFPVIGEAIGSVW